MSTGTPGPWFVKRRATKYPDLFEYDVVSGDVFSVAQGLDCPHDAALIAAAPDLLAALQTIVRLVDSQLPADGSNPFFAALSQSLQEAKRRSKVADDTFANIARAAIAKATATAETTR